MYSTPLIPAQGRSLTFSLKSFSLIHPCLPLDDLTRYQSHSYSSSYPALFLQTGVISHFNKVNFVGDLLLQPQLSYHLRDFKILNETRSPYLLYLPRKNLFFTISSLPDEFTTYSADKFQNPIQSLAIIFPFRELQLNPISLCFPDAQLFIFISVKNIHRHHLYRNRNQHWDSYRSARYQQSLRQILLPQRIYHGKHLVYFYRKVPFKIAVHSVIGNKELSLGQIHYPCSNHQ